MDLLEPLPMIYTAHSKRNFYTRDVICEFVLRRGAVPLNPYRTFGYFLGDFLGDAVKRDRIRRANNNIVRTTDEVWVFGEIADGVLFEIEYALRLGKPVRFFTVGSELHEITEIDAREAVFEAGVLQGDRPSWAT